MARTADQASSALGRVLIHVQGTVQGVGFRPFVYSLAETLGLRGSVWNSSQGVFDAVAFHTSDFEPQDVLIELTTLLPLRNLGADAAAKPIRP